MTDRGLLGADPAPGDRDALDTAAQALRRAAGDLAEAEAILQAVGAEAVRGRIAEELHETLRRELLPHVERLRAEADHASGVLAGWADTLQGHQAQATALEQEATSAAVDTENPGALEQVQERARVLQDQVESEARAAAQSLAWEPAVLGAVGELAIGDLGAEVAHFLDEIAPMVDAAPEQVADLSAVAEGLGDTAAPPDGVDDGEGADAGWWGPAEAGQWAADVAAEGTDPFQLGQPGDAADGTADGAEAAVQFSPEGTTVGELGWTGTRI